MAERAMEGGDKLRAALAKIASGLRRDGTLRVGFLSGAKYPDGTSVAMVAAIQEFGAPAAGIPPRPFFRNTIAAHADEWPGVVAAQLKSTSYDVKTTMNRVGALIKGEIQQSIRDGPFEPLKPATVARKGFAQPLIDTGQLISSVAWEFEES